MKLVIGGHAQGKLQAVLRNEGNDQVVYNGIIPDEKKIQKSDNKCIILNHFHLWVKEQILKNEQPEEIIIDFVNKHNNCIIISDEIGNGIVPIDIIEREYRERTGRILVTLAGMADEVIRIICGIEQKIK